MIAICRRADHDGTANNPIQLARVELRMRPPPLLAISGRAVAFLVAEDVVSISTRPR
jgi:hypothetical protein